MNNFIKIYKIAVGKNKDLIVFPIIGAFIWLFQSVATLTTDLSWIWNVSSWITSFIISLLTYMLFDMTLGRVKFFADHRYIFAFISFCVSTFLSETFTYTLKENLTCWHWIVAIGEYLFGFVVLLVSTVMGVSLGADKAVRRLEESEHTYSEMISGLSARERKKIISICNRALKMDDEAFELIAYMKSKEAVGEIMRDLRERNANSGKA